MTSPERGTSGSQRSMAACETSARGVAATAGETSAASVAAMSKIDDAKVKEDHP